MGNELLLVIKILKMFLISYLIYILQELVKTSYF